MLESTRLSLLQSFPNSKITLNEDQSTLNIQVIGYDENLSTAEIHKAISKALIDSGAFSKYSAATIKAYKSEKEYISKIAEELIKKSIGTTINSVVEVEFSIEHNSIYAALKSNGFHSASNREIAVKKAKEAFQKSVLASEYNITVTTQTYPETFNLSPPHDNDDSDDSYDDLDDSANPNWPSTTGNPSGGGRGNNI